MTRKEERKKEKQKERRKKIADTGTGAEGKKYESDKEKGQEKLRKEQISFFYPLSGKLLKTC
jgi:hypothetical protein